VTRVPIWETGSVGPDPLPGGPWDTVILGGITMPGRALVEATRRRKLDHKSAPGGDTTTSTDLGYEAAEITIKLTVWEQGQLDALYDAMAKLTPVPKKATVLPQREADGSLPVPYADDRMLPSGLPLSDQQITAGLGVPDNNGAPTADDYLPGPYLPALFTPGYLASISPTTPKPPAGQLMKPVTISHPSLVMPPLRIRAIILEEVGNLRQGRERGTMEMTIRAKEFTGKSSTTVLGTPNSSTPPLTSLPQAIPAGPSKTDVGP
jgi:hypothetical protein